MKLTDKEKKSASGIANKCPLVLDDRYCICKRNISKRDWDVINALDVLSEKYFDLPISMRNVKSAIDELPCFEVKFEYHYDHTDCIWYRPEARNRCPSTCAQYRDGWNDAMNYIFRDGKGYRPYRRNEPYGE